MATATPPRTAPAAVAVPTRRGIGEFLLDQRAFVALIVLVIIFSLMSDAYLQPSNLISMTKHVAYNAILALGMLLVSITGGIDLSVGSTVALSGIVAGTMLQGWKLSVFDVTAYPAVWVVVLVSLTVGGTVGWLNGLLVTKFGVAPFIATLGMMNVAAAQHCSSPTARRSRASRASLRWATPASTSSARSVRSACRRESGSWLSPR